MKKKKIYYERRAALIIWYLTGIVVALVAIGMGFGIVFHFASVGTYAAAVKTLMAALAVSVVDLAEIKCLYK